LAGVASTRIVCASAFEGATRAASRKTYAFSVRELDWEKDGKLLRMASLSEILSMISA